MPKLKKKLNSVLTLERILTENGRAVTYGACSHSIRAGRHVNLVDTVTATSDFKYGVARCDHPCGDVPPVAVLHHVFGFVLMRAEVYVGPYGIIHLVLIIKYNKYVSESFSIIPGLFQTLVI